MAKYQVIFFEKESGEVPVENFINSLDVKMAAKVYRLLVMISEKRTRAARAVLKAP